MSFLFLFIVCGSANLSCGGGRSAVPPQGAANGAQHAAGAVQGPEGDRRQPGDRGSRRGRQNLRRN